MEALVIVPLNEMKSAIEEIVSQAIEKSLTASLESRHPSPPEVLLTRTLAAEFLGVSLSTLNEWSKSGKIKGYRIGTRIRYKQSDLEQSLVSIGK